MNKKIILIVCILMSTVSLNFLTATDCECGMVGDVTYSFVVDGEDCCEDDSFGGAVYTEWTEQYPGVYAATSTTVYHEAAQDRCCN